MTLSKEQEACDKCDGSGKMPMRNYKHGFYNCSCREEIPERFHEVTPDMFDFPCSELFRGAGFNYCGVPDPLERSSVVEQDTYNVPIAGSIPAVPTKQLEKIYGQLQELRAKLSKVKFGYDKLAP